MSVRQLAILAGISGIFATAFGAREPSRAVERPSGVPRSSTTNPGQLRGQRVPVFSSTIPVAVDGAVTPGAIPDQVAYRHFIVAAGVSDDADRTALVRRTSVLNGLGLSPADNLSLLRVLKDVAAQLGKIDSGRDAAMAKAARDKILNAAQPNVQAALSAEGLTKLEIYLRDHMKPRIKIYGAVPGAAAVTLH
jgi:hypothetical protein